MTAPIGKGAPVDNMTSVRVIYTVEYEVAEGAVSAPDSEEESEFFVRSLMEAAPDRSVDIGWDDDEERTAVLEPTGWGVQTDYWGDLWTGMEPTPEPTYVEEGWWHPNVQGGQVHDHTPRQPATMHRLCEPVFTRRDAPHSGSSEGGSDA